jgi:hypothetical protein
MLTIRVPCRSFAVPAAPDRTSRTPPRRRSSLRMIEPKVEDNPLIYFLNHVLNLAIYRCNINAIWRFTCMILEIPMYTCNQNRTPRQYFENACEFIILKMNTVTIHYVNDFHTRNVYN